MEEKKRRPRISKPDSGFSLKERPKTYRPDDESENQDEKSWQDRNEGERPGKTVTKVNANPGKSVAKVNVNPGKTAIKVNVNPGKTAIKANAQDRNEGERKPWQDRNEGERKPWQDRNQSGGGGFQKRPYDPDRPRYQDRGEGERKPWQDRNQGGGGGYDRKPYNKGGGSGGFGKKPFGKKPFRKKDDFVIERKPKPGLPSGEGMPLNKYLAHCGVSSRRKAVEFIEQGQVTVNGEVKKEPYYRIEKGDIVTCEGKPVQIQERLVYVLINKPKNVITTTDDDRGRPTVIDIVDPHFPERLYPVGRLDRDTTGLLLITNDGDLAQKLSHPSHNIQKQYRVGLRRPLTQADLEHIERGVELEDGLMEVNWIRFSEDHPERDIVELEITSGRNRVVRRLFETLGYEVFKLDRFYFAGLTKRELPRGAFRELTQREIIMLKHFTGHPSTGSKNTQEEDAAGTDEEG
jgi:23S rRNA pseudouridine2605 synthase